LTPVKTFEPGAQISVNHSTKSKTVEYIVGEKIGEGADACIYSGLDHKNRQAVIKVAKSAGNDIGFRLEKEIFGQIESPHLPRILGYKDSGSQGLILVFERLYPNPLLFLNRRNIRDKLDIIYDSKARYMPLPGLTALELSYELLLAIETLHKNSYAHCDVKLSNLMVRVDNDGGEVDDGHYFHRVRQGRYRGVLIDGGAIRNNAYLHSLNAGNEDKSILAPQCTPVYSPPEVVVEPHTYSMGMDVYAAALIIYTFISGHIPYSHTERKLDPTDLLSVYEFKLAERRGEVSPINFEAIQRGFYPDSTFARGFKARAGFDHQVYTLLHNKTSKNPEDRGDIQTFLAEFKELFGFHKAAQSSSIRVANNQGVFSETSSLHRFKNAAKICDSMDEPANFLNDSGVAHVMADKALLRRSSPADRDSALRHIAKVPQIDATKSSGKTPQSSRIRPPTRGPAHSELNNKRPKSGNPGSPHLKCANRPRSGFKQAPNTERPRPVSSPNAPVSRKTSRSSGDLILGGAGEATRRPAASQLPKKDAARSSSRPAKSFNKEPKRPSGSTRRPKKIESRRPSSSFDKLRSKAPIKPDKRPSSSAKIEVKRPRRASNRQASNKVPRSGERSPTSRRISSRTTASEKLSTDQAPGREDPPTGGERIEKYFKDAEQGQEYFLKLHDYPIFYLEEHGKFRAGKDAPTTLISRQATIPTNPCIFPVHAGLRGFRGRGVSVGRANARDVQLYDGSVSRLHAALAIDPQSKKWMFADIGSANGSWVQGQKLTPLVPALMEDLCRVQIGGVKLVFFNSKSFFEYILTMI
jgi:serine/threonine protein kinase